MEATLITKSHMMYSVMVTNYQMSSGTSPYVTQGVLALDSSAIDKLGEDAKNFGAWENILDAKLLLEIDNEAVELEIRFKDLPISKSIRFFTTKIIENA